MRPATSLIGVSSGRCPFLSSIVSYATLVAPVSSMPRVSSSDAAKWKYVKTIWRSRIIATSTGCGSLTFTIMSARSKIPAAPATISAPFSRKASSVKPLPFPPSFCTKTV
jgi:hypothetical protein